MRKDGTCQGCVHCMGIPSPGAAGQPLPGSPRPPGVWSGSTGRTGEALQPCPGSHMRRSFPSLILPLARSPRFLQPQTLPNTPAASRPQGPTSSPGPAPRLPSPTPAQDTFSPSVSNSGGVATTLDKTSEPTATPPHPTPQVATARPSRMSPQKGCVDRSLRCATGALQTPFWGGGPEPRGSPVVQDEDWIGPLARRQVHL